MNDVVVKWSHITVRVLLLAMFVGIIWLSGVVPELKVFYMSVLGLAALIAIVSFMLRQSKTYGAVS